MAQATAGGGEDCCLASGAGSAFIAFAIAILEGTRHERHFSDPGAARHPRPRISHAKGQIEWFPSNINGFARQKVLDGPTKLEIIRQVGKRWQVAAAGYDALGIPRPGAGKKRIGKFEAKLDQIIANAQDVPPVPNDT